MSETKLPIHGFVLAGGKSSRMGADKARLELQGRPMVEIAVEKLRNFCAAVSIAGNRDDLADFAPVVHERREDAGPAAGIEAGLAACEQPWAMFVPVDVPLVPAEILRRWAEATVADVPEFEHSAGSLLGCSLYTQSGIQPVFAMLRPEVGAVLSEGLDEGERRISVLLGNIRLRYGHARYLRADAAWHVPSDKATQLGRWFMNVNTPEDFAEAERHVDALDT